MKELQDERILLDLNLGLTPRCLLGYLQILVPLKEEGTVLVRISSLH